MRRAIIISLYLIIIFAVLMIIFFANRKKREKKSHFTDLPSIEFVSIYKEKLNTDEFWEYDGYVLFLFGTGCSICINEAKDYYNNNSQLQNFQFFMLSPDSLYLINSFAENYKLSTLDNYVFGRINQDSIENVLGIINIPEVYLYNRNKEFLHFLKVANTESIVKTYTKTGSVK